MHVGSAILNTIVFLGYEDHTAPGEMRCTGTGFLLGYQGSGYLVTNKHVAAPLADSPFIVRVNRRDGGSDKLFQEKPVTWFPHPKPEVDLTCLPLALGLKAGYDSLYLPEELLFRAGAETEFGVDVGDICYSIGLFRYVSGEKRNLPLVYSGNIALMSDEKIPVWDNLRAQTDKVDGLLIQSQGIHGASGSPVLVRPSWHLEREGAPYPISEFGAQVAGHRLLLLGVFQSAWFLPPEAAIREDFGALDGDSVPVGLGVVIPAQRIIEMLERKDLKLMREEKNKKRAAQQTSVPVKKPAPKPADREAFNRLLGAAVKRPKSSDQT